MFFAIHYIRNLSIAFKHNVSGVLSQICIHTSAARSTGYHTIFVRLRNLKKAHIRLSHILAPDIHLTQVKTCKLKRHAVFSMRYSFLCT